MSETRTELRPPGAARRTPFGDLVDVPGGDRQRPRSAGRSPGLTATLPDLRPWPGPVLAATVVAGIVHGRGDAVDGATGSTGGRPRTRRSTPCRAGSSASGGWRRSHGSRTVYSSNTARSSSCSGGDGHGDDRLGARPGEDRRPGPGRRRPGRAGAHARSRRALRGCDMTPVDIPQPLSAPRGRRRDRRGHSTSPIEPPRPRWSGSTGG